MAVRDEATGKIEVVKAKGRLHVLEEKTDGGRSVPGSCGIGHTRWATHGEPSETNAHPHCNDDHSVALVHNGIIENYQELKEKLLKEGYQFYTATDTEVAVKLIDYYYKKTGTPLEAIARTMLRVRGSYAFGILFKDYPDRMFAVRKDSPLIVGEGVNGKPDRIRCAGDSGPDENRLLYRKYGDCRADKGRGFISIISIWSRLRRSRWTITWDAASAEKGGYAHFMMKEIHEQPKAVQDTMYVYLKDRRSQAEAIDLSRKLGLTDEILAGSGADLYRGLRFRVPCGRGGEICDRIA